ncbi:hypothetical protein NXW75_13450 [Bacteroides xylanisolvens]|nr:hypothetical protein [Bacteroides xylanisolvens]
MGNFTGVIINKVNGGLVRDTDTGDRIILLVVGGSEIGKLEYYKPENLNDITDLEALGWDDTIDLENKEPGALPYQRSLPPVSGTFAVSYAGSEV